MLVCCILIILYTHVTTVTNKIQFDMFSFLPPQKTTRCSFPINPLPQQLVSIPVNWSVCIYISYKELYSK